MYSINSISMATYGLYISTQTGIADAPDLKEQFFTAYGYEGYQITNRKGNTLELNGFIVADNLTDFNGKLAALNTVFASLGIKAIALEGAAINCYATNGYKVENVNIYPNAVYAKITMSLTIV